MDSNAHSPPPDATASMSPQLEDWENKTENCHIETLEISPPRYLRFEKRVLFGFAFLHFQNKFARFFYSQKRSGFNYQL
jgi:hypothetical protein